MKIIKKQEKHFGPKYWYVAKELGEDAKAEDILKVMEAVGGVALRLALEQKEGPFGFNKRTMIQTTTSKPKLSTSLGGTVEKNIPEDVVWIDDAFYIKKTRFGLHTSILKEPYGAHFITGMQYEDVLKMTRWHLMCLQDGSLEDYTRVVNSGVVGGKL